MTECSDTCFIPRRHSFDVMCRHGSDFDQIYWFGRESTNKQLDSCHKKRDTLQWVSKCTVERDIYAQMTITRM